MWTEIVAHRIWALEDQNARLREALDTLRQEYAAAEAFYQSVVTERNKAWAEVGHLRNELYKTRAVR